MQQKKGEASVDVLLSDDAMFAMSLAMLRTTRSALPGTANVKRAVYRWRSRTQRPVGVHVLSGISSVSNTPSPPTNWSESYECYWYLLLDYLFVSAFAIFSAVNLNQVLLAGPWDLLHDSKAHFQNITEFCYLVMSFFIDQSFIRHCREIQTGVMGTNGLMFASSVLHTQNIISFHRVYRLQCQFGTVHQSGPSRQTHAVPRHELLCHPFTTMHNPPRTSHDNLSSYHNSSESI